MYNKTRKFRVTVDVIDLNPIGDDQDVKAIVEIVTREFFASDYNINHVDVQEIISDGEEKEPQNVTKH